MAISDPNPNIQGATDGTLVGNDDDKLRVASYQYGTWSVNAVQSGTWTVTQVGTWNITNISGTISLPTGAATSANQTTANSSLSSIDVKTPALGQALAAGSVPVVLTAAQLATLTPLTTVAVTQSTSPWVTSRNWTLNNATDSVSSTLKTSGGTEISTTLYNGKTALQVTPADGPFVDGVNRIRVSDVSVLASFCFYATTHDLNFNTALTGSATKTFFPAYSSTRLTNTTSSADSVIWQSKRYFSYAPGIAHAYGLALIVGAKKTNVRQRWGHFDGSDGNFFEQTGTDLAVVIRSSTSGSAVDTRVLQANWNIDKLDGTGASGATLDTSKHNKYTVDMSWYGAGRVRFGVVVNGQLVYCHEYTGGNVNLVPYNRTPKLPMRVELTNTGTTASSTGVDVVCMSAIQESSSPFLNHYNFSKSDGRTATSVSSVLLPLISLRPATTFNGIANRTTIIPSGAQILAGAQATLCQVILNATLTGASFGSVNTYSSAEVDTSATAITGGTVIADFYVAAGAEKLFDLSDFAATIVLGQNIAATAGDVLTIAAISLAGGTNTFCSLLWKENQ